MFGLLVLFVCWRLSAAVHGYLQRYAPSNIAIRYLRSRPGLKWAIPAALALTPAYLLAAYVCTTALDRGGPGWLHLFVVVLIWDAMKFGMLGAITPLLYVERVIKSRAVSAS